MQGLPRLRQALSASYSPLFGRMLDPATEILVCQGATEGMVAALQALVDPGDEVILLEVCSPGRWVGGGRTARSAAGGRTLLAHTYAFLIVRAADDGPSRSTTCTRPA